MATGQQSNKALTVGVWVIALCGVLGVSYIFLPNVRSNVEKRQMQFARDGEAEKSNNNEKEMLLFQAKTIALAIFRYSEDHRSLPPPQSNIKVALDSYARTNNPDDDTPEELFGPHTNKVTGEDSTPFVYTLKQVTKPNTNGVYPPDIEVGYKETSFGKAVIYANGLVKWQAK